MTMTNAWWLTWLQFNFHFQPLLHFLFISFLPPLSFFPSFLPLLLLLLDCSRLPPLLSILFTTTLYSYLLFFILFFSGPPPTGLFQSILWLGSFDVSSPMCIFWFSSRFKKKSLLIRSNVKWVSDSFPILTTVRISQMIGFRPIPCYRRGLCWKVSIQLQHWETYFSFILFLGLGMPNSSTISMKQVTEFQFKIEKI